MLEINSNSDTLIFQLQGITTDNSGNIYISDKLDYKVKKFNEFGKLVFSNGRRGKGPGEFLFGPANISYSNYKKELAVIDHTTASVLFFDNNLQFVKKLAVDKPVFDVDYYPNGNLIVATPPVDFVKNSIQIFDNKLKELKHFDPHNLIGNTLYDMFRIKINKVTSMIVAMYKYRNLIQLYTTNGKLVKEISIPGLPELSETVEKGKETIVTKTSIPAKDLFWDFAIDKSGNIFVIGGEYSKHNKRDIYILDQNGSYLEQVSIKDETPFIHINDKSELFFSKNRKTSLIKYKMHRNEK
jgi:hypothetical protein